MVLLIIWYGVHENCSSCCVHLWLLPLMVCSLYVILGDRLSRFLSPLSLSLLLETLVSAIVERFFGVWELEGMMTISCIKFTPTSNLDNSYWDLCPISSLHYLNNLLHIFHSNSWNSASTVMKKHPPTSPLLRNHCVN